MIDSKSVIDEGLRQLTICNSCRYCEGYCAVWDAIEMKTFLNKSDAIHLANLCHDCRDCFYACPFNEPDHSYQLNIPRVLGDIRGVSYSTFIRPRFMRVVLEKSSSVIYTLIVLSAFASVGYALLFYGFTAFSQMNITSLIPPLEFKVVTLSVYLYTLILWVVEGLSYWKGINDGRKISFKGVALGIYEALTHKNFRGGGIGCKVPSEENKYLRGAFHALVFFGFLLALVSISAYPNLSVTVSASYLAAAISITLGALGLLLVHVFDAKGLRSGELSKIDYPFTFLLVLIGITGVPIPLIHSGFLVNFDFLFHDILVLVLFVFAPFSKFIHPVFRLISLIKYGSDREVISQV